MKIFSVISKFAAFAALSLSVASCSSGSLLSGPDSASLAQRYGETVPVNEGRVYAPATSTWHVGFDERRAETKAIAQDMPFATVKPSR